MPPCGFYFPVRFHYQRRSTHSYHRKAALQRRGIRAELEAGAEPDIYHVVYDVPKRERSLEFGKSGMVFPDNMKGCTAAFHIPSLLQFRFQQIFDRFQYVSSLFLRFFNPSLPRLIRLIAVMKKHLLYMEKHPYLQWIAKTEGNGSKDGTQFIRGCRLIEPEGMDLCIVVSGCGRFRNLHSNLQHILLFLLPFRQL